MAKKSKKSRVHVTYNQKAFLAPKSILSMAAIHAKIKPDGTAIVRISDCNQSVRIWNDFNNREEKIEMIEKVDMLINQLTHFRAEVLSRCTDDVFISAANYQTEIEKIN
jgi:hypothetical protein